MLSSQSYIINARAITDLCATLWHDLLFPTQDDRMFTNLHYTANAEVIADEVKSHYTKLTRMRRGRCRLLRKPPSLALPINYRTYDSI